MSKSNDIIRPAKGTKPRSKLQQVQSQASWVTNFCLHPLHYHHTSKIVLRESTKQMIRNYESLSNSIRMAILVDAEATKRHIRERDAKILADQVESAKEAVYLERKFNDLPFSEYDID